MTTSQRRISLLAGASLSALGLASPSFAAPWYPAAAPNDPRTRGQHSFVMVGRLASGVTMETANREVAGIARQLETEYPDINAKRGARVQGMAEAIVGEIAQAAK